MDEIEQDLQHAQDSLAAFVDGPGTEAALALEQAFGRAGQNIERVLSQAARSGELELRRMSEAVLADLARVVAEIALAQTGLSGLAQSGEASAQIGTLGTAASLIATVAARGARFA